MCTLYAPASIEWGHNALMAVVCRSVCLSVPDPNSRMEGKQAQNW